MITLHGNIRRDTTVDGALAWKATVADPFRHRQEFLCRHRRRAVIEGMFGALKSQFGATRCSRRPTTEWVEVLARAAVWNNKSLSHHTSGWQRSQSTSALSETYYAQSNAWTVHQRAACPTTPSGRPRLLPENVDLQSYTRSLEDAIPNCGAWK